MSFRCNECHRNIRTVAEVRNCQRCQSNGRAANIPAHQSDSDWLTPAIIGYALGGGFSSHSSDAPASEPEPFSGGGGLSGGAGASGSWDDDSSRSSPSSDSSSSSSDSSSSSSDSGSSSSDSGSSSSGSD